MDSHDGPAAASRVHRDTYAGALMLVIGIGAALMGVGYQIGSLSRMGPGFFPVSVGAVIAVAGVLILLGARNQSGDDAGLAVPEWRGWICIALSLVAFMVIGRFGGLLPATFALVFIAAVGDRQNTVRSALALAAAMSVICVIVFWWALRLQFPLFTWGD